jgi:ATP-dependent helicase/nuclease subunit A
VPTQYRQSALKNDARDQPENILNNENSPAARIGKAMHRLLEWGNVAPRHVAAAVREFELTPEQGFQAAAMATRILQGEGAWAWDEAVVGWHGNEVELMVQGKLMRLDRLVRRKDTDNAGQWWVLDYKSTQTPQNQPELMTQLREYRAAVQAIYPDEVVKAAFLTGHGALLEI